MEKDIAFYSYLIVAVAFYGITAYLIAHKIGRKRSIGFTNSFIISLVNPVVGFLLSINSRKRNRSIFREKELME